MFCSLASTLPRGLSDQVLIIVFIISNNQWLSFPFSFLHLTEWIKRAVNGSRPSLALSLWHHALILLFRHFFWDRCPVNALETSVYYSREEEFQEKYHHNIHDGVYHSCYSHALWACQPSDMCLFWGPTYSRFWFSVHLEWTLPWVWQHPDPWQCSPWDTGKQWLTVINRLLKAK